MLAQLYEKHPNDVYITFRHFPLNTHPLSMQAAQAAEAAGKQGKFWEFDDLLFSKQTEWAALTADQFTSWLNDQAKAMGLDVEKFKQDSTSQDVINKLNDAEKRANDAAIDHTPYVLLNGLPYDGPRDLTSLESILSLFKLEKNQYTYCPAMVIDPKKQYVATIKTEKGDIAIQLYADKAPLTVNSFVFLARNGWFNNTTFHRVIENFVAQAGDPSGSGYGGPGYAFKDEINANLNFDKEGVVGMANAGPNTNGSQFFITMGPAANLNGKFSVFGQVISGMDVVKKLTPRDVSQNPSAPPGDKIISVTITEK